MAPKRKCALEELIKLGLVRDGELLRYKSKQGQVMAVGRAREGGIEVAGSAELLNYSAFEATSGSKYRRPAEHTHTARGRSLQSLSLSVGGGSSGAGGGRSKAKAKAPEPEVELLEDANDDLCHVCGLGGDLMCCEACPAVFHAPCLGLDAPPEGDYFCPLCRCTTCGEGGSQGAMPTGCSWVDCSQFVSPTGVGRPHIASDPPAAKPAPTPTEAAAKDEPAAAELGAEAASLAADAGGGAAPMDVDGPVGGAGGEAGAEGLADFSRLQALPAQPPAGHAPADAAGATAAAAAASGDAAVHCPVTGSWSHLRCLPPDAQGALLSAADAQLCFSGTAAAAAAQRLAAACAAGALQLGALRQGVRPTGDQPVGELPLSLLVVRGAAAAAPRDCRGCAPAYSGEQRQELRVALSAALHVLHSCYAPIPDSRTGADLLPWLLRGAVLEGGADFSAVHTALLYVGQTVAASAVFRSFGELAEVPVLAVRPELQRRNGLGRLLLAAVEQLLLLAGAKTVLMPAVTAEGAPYISLPQPVAAPPAGPEGAPGGAADAPMRRQGQEAPAVALQAAVDVPPLAPPLQHKWGYGLAPAEVMREATRHPVVRIPGVLLACKRLDAASGLPPPRLPERLRWSGAAGIDVRPLLRYGWLASVAAAAHSLPTARATPTASPPLKSGRPPKAAAGAVKDEPSPAGAMQQQQAPAERVDVFTPAAVQQQQQQQQQQQATAATCQQAMLAQHTQPPVQQQQFAAAQQQPAAQQHQPEQSQEQQHAQG